MIENILIGAWLGYVAGALGLTWLGGDCGDDEETVRRKALRERIISLRPPEEQARRSQYTGYLD